MDLPCNGIAFFLENLHWFVVDTVWSKLSLTAAMTHSHACNSPSTFSRNINERLCITFNINLILIKAITSKESSQSSYSATALTCLRRLRTYQLFMRINGLEILCTLIFFINKFINRLIVNLTRSTSYWGNYSSWYFTWAHERAWMATALCIFDSLWLILVLFLTLNTSIVTDRLRRSLGKLLIESLLFALLDSDIHKLVFYQSW